MRRCVFLIIFVLLIQTLQIYAQTHNPMPLFPDDETHDGLYFPNALLQGELSAEFPVRRLLIWADEGDTLQASMTRMSGEYFPAMELYNSEGELLASVLSSEQSGYLSTSPLAFTIQSSAWYYLHLSHEPNTRIQSAGSYVLETGPGSTLLYHLVKMGLPPSTDARVVFATQLQLQAGTYRIPIESGQNLVIDYGSAAQLTDVNATLLPLLGSPASYLSPIHQWLMLQLTTPVTMRVETSGTISQPLTNRPLSLFASSTPSPTPSPSPTDTASPTRTSSPTLTPSLTLTPRPTMTASPSNTPTATVSPSSTSSPTLTPSLTFTPRPTITASPSNTPTATNTLSPSPGPITNALATVALETRIAPENRSLTANAVDLIATQRVAHATETASANLTAEANTVSRIATQRAEEAATNAAGVTIPALQYGDRLLITAQNTNRLEYRFDGQAQDIVTIIATSLDFDVKLELFYNNRLLSRDDDSAGLTNAMITDYPLEQTGSYTIVITETNGERFEGEIRLYFEEGYLVLLENGVGLTDGNAVNNGNMQVETACDYYNDTTDNNERVWFCRDNNGNRTVTLRQDDFERICRDTYNYSDAIALQTGSNRVPAYRWLCFGLSSTVRGQVRVISGNVNNNTNTTNSAACGRLGQSLFERGDTAIVDFDNDGALRLLRDYEGEATVTIAQYYDGDEIVLLDGPICHNQVWYWQVYDNRFNAYGWVAEGEGSDRYLCPVARPNCS